MRDSDLPSTEEKAGFFRRLRFFGTWLCLLIALYFATALAFAAMHFERYGTATPHLLRYIVVPALIMLAYFALPFLIDRKKSLMVGIYSMAVMAALFLSEAFLTIRLVPVLLGSLGQLSEEQRQELENDEDMIRGFTLAYLNAKGEVDTLPEAKLSGFAGARTLLCTPPEGSLIYTADRFGFNNPDEIYDRDADLLVIGDSFIEGFCLPDGEDFVSALRDQGKSTVGFGIRGNGPLFELATLGRFGPALRPDHVVMAFFEGNDWRNFRYELTQPWLRAALEPDADFGAVPTPDDESEQAYWTIVQGLTEKPVATSDLLFRTAIVRNFFALQRTGQALGVIYPKLPAAMPEYEDVLRRAKAVAASWGGTFTLMYIPDAGRFGSLLPVGFAFDPLRDMVLDAARAADVEVIDLTPIFAEEPNTRQRLYAANGHFSEEGADFVADIVADIIGSDEKGDRLANNASPPVSGERAR